MKYLTILGFVAVVGLLAGCSTPEEQVANEKMKLSKAYQECAEKAKTYKSAMAAGTEDQIREADRVEESDCETIRKNLEALN